MSVIECRNKTALDSSAGDWTTTLNENILIEQGDVIRVKDSVIDTQAASSQKILIPSDINISMDYGFYQINDEQIDYMNFQNTGPPDGKTHTNFVLTQEFGGTGVLEFQFLNDYKLESLDKNTLSKEGDLTFSYKNQSGRPESRIINIKSLNSTEIYQVTELINIVFKGSGPQAAVNDIKISPSLASLNLKISSTQNSDITQNILVPYIMTKTIKINAGNYDPDELAKLINLEMNNNSLFDSPYVTTDIALLQTSQQIQSRFLDPTTKKPSVNFALASIRSNDVLSPYQPMRVQSMIDFDGKSLTIQGIPIFFGASIFELSYTQSSSQFKIDYLHTPVYNNTEINIRYINLGSLNQDSWLTIDKLGGVFLSNLYAETIQTGEPFDFWDRMLGLNINDIGTKFKYVSLEIQPPSSPVVNIWNPVTDDLTTGKGTTGGLATLDGVIQKTDPAKVPLTNFTVSADPSSTNAIIGSTNNILNNQVPFGYYLIEINSQFKNEFLTPENNFRNVSQIVNKYQTFDSFTYGESGQLQYEHKGEPMLLQSFKCRILDSDKNVAPNIGTDSTIHIEIIKGIPQLPPPSKTAGKK